jgi:predicted permease
MTLRDLRLRARALFRPNRAEQDLRDELEFHVERETRKLIDEGMPAAAARARARARFGSTMLTADRCRDERGTALVENAIRDVQYAVRTFAKAPLAACTIVVTVALGLGVVAVLFTIVNALVFHVDNVPGVNRIYQVQRPPSAGEGQAPLTRPAFDAMRRETSVFTDAYAAANTDLRVDGRMMAVTLVTGNFFQTVGVSPVLGRALTPADDRAGGNPVVVLSAKGWDRHFHRDPNVIGRTLLVRDATFEIVGVTPEGFRGLEPTAPDLWAPLSQVSAFQPQYRGRENDLPLDIIGRLQPGVSMENARTQLAAWDVNRSPRTTERGGLSLDLVPHRGTIYQPMELATFAVFAPLFVAFGLILLIGCANVANLLLARGVVRQREIGIRLSLGASRKRIVRQLMTESLLLALVAAAGGYLISRLALQGTVYWALRAMPLDLGDISLGVPGADWRVAAFLVAAAIAATGFFALMPALHATGIDPVRTLRGELVKDAKPGRARNGLIGLQVFASALLLICAAIFLRSALASSRFDPGVRTADTVLIEMNNEPKRAAIVQALAGESTITAHAAERPQLLAPLPVAAADAGRGKTSVAFKSVSSAYFDVLGIPIVRGRAFRDFERDGDPVAIVSESVARALWPNGGGVGESFRLEPDLSAKPEGEALADRALTQPRTVTVIGVAREVPGFRFTDVKQAGVFLPTTLDAAGTSAVARVQGPPNLARETLLDHLTKVDPSLGNVITMQTLARLEVFFLQIAFWVSLVLGGLALLLTISGLFSVLSYLVEQRRREIGVRMALGASPRTVARLMLAQTTRPVLYGLIAGTAAAAALAAAVIATPVGALISQIVHVTDPVAYGASLLVITAACLAAAWIPAARAARLDPMRTLRQE